MLNTISWHSEDGILPCASYQPPLLPLLLSTCLSTSPDRLSSYRLAILLVDNSLAICWNMPCTAQSKEIIFFQHCSSQIVLWEANLDSVVAQQRASCRTPAFMSSILLSNTNMSSIWGHQLTKASTTIALYWNNRLTMQRRSGVGEACVGPADQEWTIALISYKADLGFCASPACDTEPQKRLERMSNLFWAAGNEQAVPWAKGQITCQQAVPAG